MRIRYSTWRREIDLQKHFEKLLKLFNLLLLQTSGDVEEAIEWFKYLNEKYRFLRGESELQEFIKDMEKRGFIQRNGERYIVTAKGNIKIRRDSLHQVFSGLKKGGTGNHAIPRSGQGTERLSESRPYQFGDGITDLNITGTKRFPKGEIHTRNLSVASIMDRF